MGQLFDESKTVGDLVYGLAAELPAAVVRAPESQLIQDPEAVVTQIVHSFRIRIPTLGKMVLRRRNGRRYGSTLPP